jgi:NADH-quinone oxidoreductase subunit F
MEFIKKSGKPRHLVCNADESEPGTFKDRYLMEFIPHLLIEGMIPSVLPGANLSISTFVEYMWVYKILEETIAEAAAELVR